MTNLNRDETKKNKNGRIKKFLGVTKDGTFDDDPVFQQKAKGYKIMKNTVPTQVDIFLCNVKWQLPSLISKNNKRILDRKTNSIYEAGKC